MAAPSGLGLLNTLVGRRYWASCLRRCSASSSASRGFRRTGWWPGSPAIYVEVIRNLPLLLQLLFWYNAVLEGAAGAARQRAAPGRRISQQPRAVPAASRCSRRAPARCWLRWPSRSLFRIAYPLLRQAAADAHRAAGAGDFASPLALVIGLPLAGAAADRLSDRLPLSRRRGASTSAAAWRCCPSSWRCCSGW